MAENELILLLLRRPPDLIIAFVQNSPFVLLLAAIALFGMCLAVIFAVLGYKKQAKKRALMTEEILPAMASGFGTNVAVWEFGKSIGNSSVALQFTRHGTNFNAQILRTAGNEFENALSEYKAEFRLTKPGEQFYISPRSNSSDFSPRWRDISVAGIPDDIVFNSRNPSYSTVLINNEKIRSEILKYRNDASTKFEISFDGGVFIISQTFASEDDSETEAERIEQICRTAVVFHEVLNKN